MSYDHDLSQPGERRERECPLSRNDPVRQYVPTGRKAAGSGPSDPRLLANPISRAAPVPIDMFVFMELMY
jgi:hypothetical protein